MTIELVPRGPFSLAASAAFLEGFGGAPNSYGRRAERVNLAPLGRNP
jgi:hypothetical protein